jgi:peptidase A4-like protein
MRNSSSRGRQAVLIATALTTLLGVVAAGLGAVGASSTSRAQVNAAVTQVSSLNWAGYADSAPSNSVTVAAGAWVEPSVHCSSHRTTYAVFWVGIDGFNSNTVEQTGTLALCASGKATYSAWWELFPLNSIQVISSFPVSAGDAITASVTFSTAGFTMAITDHTNGHSFSITATQSGTARSSAECIAERPSIGGSLTSLANFGTMTFSSCTATISGSTVGIGAYSNANAITMVDLRGLTLARPSATSNSGQTFSITWVRSR